MAAAGHEALPSRKKWNIEVPKHGDSVAFGGCRSIEDSYVRSKQIGQGTYGEVFLGRSKDEPEGPAVALKKIRMENEKEGFPITAIREIKLLKRLKHDNVICLKEIVRSQAHSANNMKGSIYMVFDYMDHDMTGYMERVRHKLDLSHAKSYIVQLLKGLHYCHYNNVLHRDLKLSNLLVDNNGRLKIADFGLARVKDMTNELNPMTNKVITLWYRPPELLLGSMHYGKEIDLWSVGCIIVEILTGKPLFPGATEVEQLDRICKIMGPLNQKTMGPQFAKWPQGHMARQDYRRNSLKQHLESRKLSPSAIDVVSQLLALDPSKRISALDATEHKFFWESPSAATAKNFPKLPASHEKDLKDLKDAQKRQHGQGSAPGKRGHSQVEGVHPEPDSRQRMRTDAYGHPAYASTSHNPHAAMHPAGAVYADGAYGQYGGRDPYAGGRDPYASGHDPYGQGSYMHPAHGHTAYRGGPQAWAGNGAYSHHGHGPGPPQSYGQRGADQPPLPGERPKYLTRKR